MPMEKKYRVSRCILLSTEDEQILKREAQKAGMNVNQYIRALINKKLSLRITEKDIESIKKYLLRQHCLYCREYGLETLEESSFDKEVVQCQTCQRKMLYLPRNGYYDLVPYDFFSQLQLPEPEDNPLYKKKREVELEEMKKILLREVKKNGQANNSQ